MGDKYYQFLSMIQVITVFHATTSCWFVHPCLLNGLHNTKLWTAQPAYSKMASYILYVFEAYMVFLCCPFAYTRKSWLTSSEVENYLNAIQPCKCKRVDYPIID
jgi:hypothetical protein